MRRRWSGRLWGSRSVTAERDKGDHIFASARAHVAVQYKKTLGARPRVCLPELMRRPSSSAPRRDEL
eukprot:1408344-Prymnesium_polylepis.1